MVDSLGARFSKEWVIMNTIKKVFYLLTFLGMSNLALAQDVIDIWGMGSKVIGTISSVNAGSINFEGRKLYLDAATRVEDQFGNLISSSHVRKGEIAFIHLRETSNKTKNYIANIRIVKK